MNAIQVNNAVCPQAYRRTTPARVLGLGGSALPPARVAFALRPSRVPGPVKITNGGQKCIHLAPVCLSRSDARSGSGDQDPMWKSFGKALENFGKNPSVEELLRQQIEKGEYYDDEEDGSGGNPPGGRGGAGGGGGSGSFGESEEENLAGILDETIQVVLATLGFIFVYAYIINGAEISRLAKDYIKFLFGGGKSVRLTRALLKWERFYKKLTGKKKKKVDKFWLERAILNTPTWWHRPKKTIKPKKSDKKKESKSYDEYGSIIDDDDYGPIPDDYYGSPKSSDSIESESYDDYE